LDIRIPDNNQLLELRLPELFDRDIVKIHKAVREASSVLIMKEKGI
jgi:hypothetical protein